MIRKLEIKNFQSHKETKLKFHPGVNVIIGRSDSGKTAILRALKWAVWNRPLGDPFRSHWGGDTSARISLKEGTAVERFKGKQDFYVLMDGEEEPLEFKAFGTEPPEEITQALNLSDINIQNQMDAAFLISNNPGEVSRHFNKVANLEQIDSSLKAVESWLRKEKQSVEHIEANIEQYKKDLESFAYLEKFETKVEVLEQMENEKEKGWKSVDRISKQIDQIQEIEKQIEKDSEILKAEKAVNTIIGHVESRATTTREFKELKALYKAIEELCEAIATAEELIEDENLINSVLELYNKKSRMLDRESKIIQLVGDITQNQIHTKDQKKYLDELEEQWHENMPDICPLCGK